MTGHPLVWRRASCGWAGTPSPRVECSEPSAIDSTTPLDVGVTVSQDETAILGPTSAQVHQQRTHRAGHIVSHRVRGRGRTVQRAQGSRDAQRWPVGHQPGDLALPVDAEPGVTKAGWKIGGR